MDLTGRKLPPCDCSHFKPCRLKGFRYDLGNAGMGMDGINQFFNGAFHFHGQYQFRDHVGGVGADHMHPYDFPQLPVRR